ncbi:hypothetical protein SAY87_006798 [Trapa incisa]|uniref:Ubiquinol-cytochrome c chaperone domain-containing protein n=1 Tax=Trapa incisa TaxID=236973 RepID=A0AAN7JZ90_9MYRT|nr:hypothetical protein SAY87_006798 [Trapa incisa]
MLSHWSRAINRLSRPIMMKHAQSWKGLLVLPHRNFAKISAASAPTAIHSSETGLSDSSGTAANLGKMFRSKPCSLALAPDSPLRVEEPNYEGIKRFFLKIMLFYSKQSKSIRGANVVYQRILSQVNKPPVYEVFNLEKTFKTTFSLLVLHMWLFLRRLKEEGKEGAEFGQYVYEIYNHDVELRVSKAGVNLLLTKWMKDLEKIFYGNIVAYDTAMLPEAKQDVLVNAVWRNIFSEDGSPLPTDPAVQSAVQAMARYARRESLCLSLTDREAIFSGNFIFTPLKSLTKPTKDGQLK